ncbi:hypothetical protein AB0C07_10880 [Actinoplanes missouriensis]|uniref:NucA/NucB deoxyribonuclease domain-containing protein n=1 Tax=Actinoplanes missouriensis TaxID=1866 RepID=UPI0033DD281A
MRRPRSVVAALALGVLVSVGLTGTPGPARADEPVAADKDFGAVSYLGRPTVDKDGNVSVKEPKTRRATAADADRIAVETKQKSYLDPTVAAAATPPRTPPAVPNAEADACLSSPGANTAMGRVHNRFIWCQRWTMNAVRGSAGPGVPGGIKLAEMNMSYDAVAYGRDDGRRGVTIFFKSTGLTLTPPRKGYIRENSVLYQKIDCTGDATAERPSSGAGCDSSASYIGKQLDDWDDDWTSWTISSDASVSQAADSVLLHQWQFHGYVVDSFGYRLSDALAEKHTVRCDSASIFGKRRSAACINDDVIPHLQYSAAPGSSVKEVAEHLACAQDMYCLTYPIKDTAKVIPGKFVDGQRLDTWALHRVRSAKTNSPIADANRAVVRTACGRLTPDVYDTSKGQECDEYPFASTMEGAACCEPPAFDWDYSIKGVNKDHNKCAGNALKKYYRDDRILYKQDGFFVRITDAPPAGPESCDAIPEDEDEPDTGGGGGGGEPVEDLPPTVSAGPDVFGDEGGPVALNGSASDPESGTPDVRWSFRPVSGVDAGATCSFSATAAAGTAVTCTDDGVFEVTITGSDGVNAAVSDSALVTLGNVSPGFGVSPLSATARVAAAADDELPENPGIVTPSPWQVFRKGDTVKLAVSYTEPAENDTHTCVTTWDDGTTSTYPGVDRVCKAEKTFDRAGMFTIRTTVTDDDGGSGSAEVMVIVYDPYGGWANVDGSYDSPAGALTGAPAAVGEGWAHLTGRYYPQNNLSVPQGATRNWLPVDPYRFDINVGTLEWLVVTPDGKVAAKTTGTLAGSSERYGIVFYAYEGCAGATRAGACQTGPDRVRTVVWPLSKGSYPTGDVFYDSRASAGYDVDVAEPLTMRTGTTLIQWP